MQTFQLHRGKGIAGLERVPARRAALQAHEVRVRMGAVALNFRDLEVARAGDASGPPITPCSDGAGVVEELGSAATRWRIGDRVAASFFPNWIDGPSTDGKVAGALGNRGPGMLAESVVLPEAAWFAVPPSLSLTEAATLPCAGVTAWNGLFVAGAAMPGHSVLLLGTGGVSMWALQLARAAGLHVLVTSSDDRKLLPARQLGAHDTINYRSVPDWPARVRELTGGLGAHLVLETAGRDTLARSLAAVRREGRVSVIGGTSGWGGELNADALIDGALHLRGVLVGSRSMAEDLVRFVEQNRLRPMIDRVFPFAQAAAAYEYLAASRHIGKVVIALGEG
jgi:NADPH:quinone reductase-like Zn-dependent oxidoreductase